MEINDFNEPTSIKEAIQGLVPDGAGVIQGRVTSVSPLVIQAVNDDKLILQESTLCLPKHLTNYTMTVSISGGSVSSATRDGEGTHPHGSSGQHDGHTEGDGAHNHPNSEGAHIHTLSSFALSSATITVHNALKVGEVVYLLSYNNGKKYYILDRKAG